MEHGVSTGHLAWLLPPHYMENGMGAESWGSL